MQEKRKGPRPLTEEEIQRIEARKAEVERKLATDPEFKKQWEKKTAIFRKSTLWNDSTPE